MRDPRGCCADVNRPSSFRKTRFGEMREMGVRGLLVYCSDFRCRRDRAKHCAANKRYPDHSQLFHEILPSLQDAAPILLLARPVFPPQPSKGPGFLAR